MSHQKHNIICGFISWTKLKSKIDKLIFAGPIGVLAPGSAHA